MNLKIRLLIIFLFFSNTAYSQVALNFEEKDVIDLPGSNILDLKIQDVNNDNFPDYIYKDQDSVYIVDGISGIEIAGVSQTPYFRAFAAGDVNSDNYADLILAGYYSDNIDLNYIRLFLGPDFTTDYTYDYAAPSGDWRIHPVDLFVHNFYGQDLLFVGNKKGRGGNNSYYYWSETRGILFIMEFQNNQFNLLHNLSLSGTPKSFLYCHENSSEIIAFTAFGEDFEAIPDQGYFNWDNWTNIMIYDGSSINSIWYTTGDSDYYTQLGHVRGMIISQPQIGDFHLYFLNFSDSYPHESVVCREIPYVNGHNWQIPDDWGSYASKKMAITDATGDGQDDVFIFNPVEIRNAFTGDLINTGLATGHRGLYVTYLDQENDGADEFFFKSSDSLYVFNLQIPTKVADEYENIPSIISISDNYPNPFNAVTNFQITIENEVSLKLEIFDILGRKVLPDRENILNEGVHNISLECTDLMSGIYFARFSIPDFSTTRKINLLK